MGLATGWRFGRRTSLHAAAGEGPDGRASVRLTAAHGGPLAAGRYLLDVETRAQDVPVLTIDVDTAREEVVHAVDLDFGNAGRGGRAKAFAPIVLTQDGADRFAGQAWRRAFGAQCLRERAGATFYGGRRWGSRGASLPGARGYSMLREAIRRNGVGGAVRGDWEALALPRCASASACSNIRAVGTMSRRRLLFRHCA